MTIITMKKSAAAQRPAIAFSSDNFTHPEKQYYQKPDKKIYQQQ
jgi:hypothetical protein